MKQLGKLVLLALVAGAASAFIGELLKPKRTSSGYEPVREL